MKKHLSTVCSYLIAYIGGIWVGMLVVVLSKIPFDMFFSPSLFVERVYLSVTIVVSASIFLYCTMKKLGYKNAQVHLRKTIIIFLVIFFIQHIVVLAINGYLDQFTGGARSISEVIWLGNEKAFYKNGLPQDIPFWSYHLVMFILNIVIYLPIALLGQYHGMKKRINDRKQLGLTENDTHTKEII